MSEVKIMPKLDTNTCLKCYACISACGSGAISESQNGPKFDDKKCTKCGACVNICPVSAITL